MSKIVKINPFRVRQRAENSKDIFGLCPVCKAAPIIRNIHKSHIAACDKHRVCWDVGWNLFSSWQYEDEQNWRDNAALLESYREVGAYFFPRKQQATTDQPADFDLPF